MRLSGLINSICFAKAKLLFMIGAVSFHNVHCDERIDWEPEVCHSFTPDLSSF